MESHDEYHVETVDDLHLPLATMQKVTIEFLYDNDYYPYVRVTQDDDVRTYGAAFQAQSEAEMILIETLLERIMKAEMVARYEKWLAVEI